jgi:GT2 family glycosyltransferase
MQVRWLDAHPEVGALAPAVTKPDGTPDFLCKRYPAVFDLFLRGFAPAFLKRWFRRRLDRYDMRDVIDPAGSEAVRDVPVMSGCCMLVRRNAIDTTGGFDPKFFLYFEDFDWSVRLNKVTQTAWLPSSASSITGRRRAQGLEAHRLVHEGARSAFYWQAWLALLLIAYGGGAHERFAHRHRHRSRRFHRARARRALREHGTRLSRGRSARRYRTASEAQPSSSARSRCGVGRRDRRARRRRARGRPSRRPRRHVLDETDPEPAAAYAVGERRSDRAACSRRGSRRASSASSSPAR